MKLNDSRRAVRMTATGFALALLSVCTAGEAKSAVIAYYDSASFNAALASTTFFDNYESYADGTLVANGSRLPAVTGPVYTFSGGNSGFIDGTTYVPFSGINAFARNNGGVADEFAPGSSVTLTFDTPVTAVALYFNGDVNTNAGDFSITTGNGESVSNIHNPVLGNFALFETLFFVGLTSDTPFTSVTFSAIPGAVNGFTFDDVQAGIATQTGAPIPAPAALVVFGGLMAVGFARRRKG